MPVYAGAQRIAKLYKGSTPIARAYKGATQVFERYHANGVNFDGTNDYLSLNSAMTGVAASKLFTLSFWANVSGAGATQRLLHSRINTSNDRFFIVQRQAADNIAIAAENAAGSSVLVIASSTDSIEDGDGWVNFLCSVNLSDTGKRHLYINDASDLTVTTYVDDLIDFATDRWSVGADAVTATNKYNGDLADLWFVPGVYIDLSVEANRRKFIQANGKPADLGKNGELPTGTPPLIFQSRRTGQAASVFATNRGTGGGFTENGALTDAATSPGD